MQDVCVRKPSEEEKALLESCPTWEHEPEVFDTEYDQREETCLVIDGKASIVLRDGTRIPFGVGDLVTFKPGLKCTWDIEKTIKKYYIFNMGK